MIVALLLQMVTNHYAPALDDFGPPHEDLLRTREQLDSVLCMRPDRASRETDLVRRYDTRLEALQAAVEARFGKNVADRGYVTVQSCLKFRDEASFQRSWHSATERLEHSLRNFEWHYVVELTKVSKIKSADRGSGAQRSGERH